MSQFECWRRADSRQGQEWFIMSSFDVLRTVPLGIRYGRNAHMSGPSCQRRVLSQRKPFPLPSERARSRRSPIGWLGADEKHTPGRAPVARQLRLCRPYREGATPLPAPCLSRLLGRGVDTCRRNASAAGLGAGGAVAADARNPSLTRPLRLLAGETIGDFGAKSIKQST
jgi:hypothetical protein